MSDIEKRRSVEELLPVTTERDPVTHLYTQATFIKLINNLMRGAGATEHLYSLAVIRMLGLSAMSARIGSENVDMEQMFLGRFICALLDSDCIVGRYNDDCFLVFCANAQSDEWMRDKIEDAILRVGDARSSNNSGYSIRLVCGIATEKARNSDFSGMLSQAMRICDSYKNAETDKVRTFEEYVDSFRLNENAMKLATFYPVETEELNRPLFGFEKEAMAECMTAMLFADNIDA